MLNRQRNLPPFVRLILLTGETGSGKNYIARVLAAHRQWLSVAGSDADLGLEAGINHYTHSFGEILLTALPDTLVESLLFGVRKGAFTDAKQDKAGMLGGSKAQVDYKDILLDEIGDASRDLQAKLLTLIDRGEFLPVGSNPGEEEKTSARIIMATNRELVDLVSQKTFRDDLYWRARQFVMRVPSLREQPENIELIARKIEKELQKDRPAVVGKAAEDNEREPKRERSAVRSVTADDELCLLDEDIRWARTYGWPGNIRQLQDGIRRFLFEEGACRLRDIIADGADSSVPEDDSIKSAVVRILNEVLTDPTAPAVGSIQKLFSKVDKEVQAAVVEWYDTHQLKKEQLQRVFPEVGHNSVVNKISQYRKKQ